MLTYYRRWMHRTQYCMEAAHMQVSRGATLDTVVCSGAHARLAQAAITTVRSERPSARALHCSAARICRLQTTGRASVTSFRAIHPTARMYAKFHHARVIARTAAPSAKLFTDAESQTGPGSSIRE